MSIFDPYDPPTRPDLQLLDGGRGPDESPPPVVAPTADLDEHRRRAIAAVGLLPDGAVLSHVSAACLLDLPIWEPSLLRGPVQALRPRPAVTISRVTLQVRPARLAPEDVTELDGIPVTGLARTLIDLGRWAAVSAAVVCLDAALRDGRVSPAELQAALDGAYGTIGVPRARIAVGFADGRARDVAESRARVAKRWPEPVAPSRPYGDWGPAYRHDDWPADPYPLPPDDAHGYGPDPDETGTDWPGPAATPW